MEDQIKSINNDIKEISKDINEIKISLAAQAVDLNHHIRRTDLAEKRIELLQKAMWISLGAFLVIEFILRYGK